MKNKGFTLIELVVVIVILGILAATAAPKFIDLTSDAYTATLEGVEASMHSAGAMVNAKSIVAGNQDEASATVDIGDGLVDGEGNPVGLGITFGYPDGQLTTWLRLIDFSPNDFSAFPLGTDGRQFILFPTDYGAPDDLAEDSCFIWYTESQGAGLLPDINLVECE